jgi:hypothetical protein
MTEMKKRHLEGDRKEKSRGRKAGVNSDTVKKGKR